MLHFHTRCRECHSHFLQMYTACDNGRCEIPKVHLLNLRRDQPHPAEGEAKLALWVWQMHNAVNARVAREQDEKVDVET